MDRRSSFEDIFDLGMSYSLFSADSRTHSDASVLSDENCFSDVNPTISWQGMKSPAPEALSKLMKNEEVVDSEMELMKERFSKLLLGEDMSGSGKGVCSAVALSNAITNLYASVFGEHHRLQPLHPEKKTMWKREVNCLLSVCDHIQEFRPTLQTLKDGTSMEVMTSFPRKDIYINLPALKKLDAMLLDAEFWYAEKRSMSGNSLGSTRRIITQPVTPRKQEKWWLPVPCVPEEGLSEKIKKLLKQKRNCANQIHKAAMAINSGILAEMQIPESFLASIPKSGKASVGDEIYRYLHDAEVFSPDHLLDSLIISSEHEALELADEVEASIHAWRRKVSSYSKSSWEMVKGLVLDVDRSKRNHILAQRAEALLLCLKLRYPELSQTALDASKIQHNKDVGQAVLESYSRVLESMAFSIVAWIEDVLFADKVMKSPDRIGD